MKSPSVLPWLLATAGLSSAFPADMNRRLQEEPQLQKRAAEIYEQLSKRQSGTPVQLPETWSPKQLIDVSGKHAFVPPGEGDLRGPCPGLNAFANHNYLPHNGYATIAQFLDATMSVVGMSLDLAGFLSVYGALINGNVIGWSIGGSPGGLLGGLGGDGISGSHNNYEGDASPMRPDLYQAGNNYKVVVEQFEELTQLQPAKATANYNIDVLTKFRQQRFDKQIATNPYFLNGPFSGVLVQPAAYTFIYRFMANHTEEHPEGILDEETLKSWFGITGERGSFQVKDGWERIPEYWYRRDFNVPYSIPYFLAEVAAAGVQYPQFFDIGGNTGSLNSFTGLDLLNLTGGVFNAKDFADPKKLGCYLYQMAAQISPDLLLKSDGNILNYLAPVIPLFDCPQLRHIDVADLAQYPGWKRN